MTEKKKISAAPRVLDVLDGGRGSLGEEALKHRTSLGWMVTNFYERWFGKGAADQGEFENIKLKFINMVSELIGKFKDSFLAETEKRGAGLADAGYRKREIKVIRREENGAVLSSGGPVRKDVKREMAAAGKTNPVIEAGTRVVKTAGKGAVTALIGKESPVKAKDIKKGLETSYDR